MSLFDTQTEAQPISPEAMTMMTQTLDVWCRQNKIPRTQSRPHARVMIETYISGKRSQMELIDALMRSKH